MRSILLTLLFALAAKDVFGVDGQILINQASVMAQGGFPFKIDESGSYKLSGNLVVPAGSNGIAISVPNVTIDLNGFSITTPMNAGQSSFGIYSVPTHMAGGVTVANDVSGITIRNGVIRGFFGPIYNQGPGVALPVYGFWTLEDLILDFGDVHVYLDFGTGTLINKVSGLNFTIQVTCPSIVSLTVAYAVADLGPSPTCSFSNNATAQD